MEFAIWDLYLKQQRLVIEKTPISQLKLSVSFVGKDPVELRLGLPMHDCPPKYKKMFKGIGDLLPA